MTLKTPFIGLIVAAVAVASTATFAVAEETVEQSFQRGFYYEDHEGDPSAAIVAYQKVLADANAPDKLRDEARLRAARCQEDVRTADFAELMPPDALAFVELSNPGAHVAQLARLLGLLGAPKSAPVKDSPSGMPLGDGVFLPEDLSISPDLIAELEKIRGVAAAVTSIDRRGNPTGVAVIHPGKSDLLRGLTETGIQFLEPSESIEGFKTYCVENDVWIVVTHRLWIISPSRDEVAAVVSRLTHSEANSLAKQPDFARLKAQRQHALVYTYVAGRSIAEAIQQQGGHREAAMARAALDLDHLENLTAALRTTDSNIEVEVRLNLKEGHHNILHSVVRTAPITQQSLRHVPAGSAAVAVLGLNPVVKLQAGESAPVPTISLMDIGRELFGNIFEASLFVLSAEAEKESEIPEIGIVFAVRESDKSEAMWNQMLALPAMFGLPAVHAPREITIDGHPVTEFSFPDAPPILLAKLEDDALVAGTPRAVAAAIQAGRSGMAIADDPVLRPFVDTLSPSSSKTLFAHAARLLDVVASLDPGEAKELRQAQALAGDLTVLLVTDESPNAFVVRAEIAGLPNVPNVVKHVVRGSREGAKPVALINN